MTTGNFPEYVRPTMGDEMASTISMAVKDAIQYVEEELIPLRAKATEYYQGKPFGNEMEGRSQAIQTEVRDGILGVLPSLLRVIHGPEHVVEFVPKRADAVAMAEQATDYVRYVYENDNAGFLITHAVLKDALLKKIGIAKWGIDSTPQVSTTRYKGINRADLAFLASDPEIQIAPTQVGEDLFDCEVSKMEPAGRSWVMAVPPDDFFWNRDARSLESATLIGHRARPTKGELRAMGVSEKDLEEYGGIVHDTDMTLEERARRSTNVSGFTSEQPMGDENQRVLYCEVYLMLDMNGSGVAELRRVCTLGPNYTPIKNEPVDERPFAIYTPDPEPHAFLGGSWYDLLADMQRINSQLLRGQLDSLSISLFPRVAYVDGQASVADILNTAIGAPMRERLPNMIRSFEQPFNGDKVMPLMGLMREMVERRTGQKDGAGSLDMDALQSTGKEAVNAAIVAAQSQAELLTRIFAEQFMKPLFKGLLKLANRPESKARIVRLRGTYVPVQPSTWDADMDVSVNVALGTMDVAKKVGVLREVVADQSAILQEFGPENPVVDIAMLRNAKAKILHLNGVKDVESYYKPVPDGWKPPPPPPPEPSEDELWRQAEKEMAFQKDMKELAIKQDEMQLKAQQLQHEYEFKTRELAIKEADSIRDASTGPHNAEIERYKADLDAANTLEEIASRERIEAAKLALEREKLLLDAELRRYEAEVAATSARESATISAESSERAAEKKDKQAKAEPKEKAEPVVINVMPAAAPNVNVEAPVINIPKAGKRKGKMTGPDGKTYQMESED